MSRALSATSDEQHIWEITGTHSLSSLTGASHEGVLVACFSLNRHACNHETFAIIKVRNSM
jgi:hypothetical protein